VEGLAAVAPADQKVFSSSPGRDLHLKFLYSSTYKIPWAIHSGDHGTATRLLSSVANSVAIRRRRGAPEILDVVQIDRDDPRSSQQASVIKRGRR